MQVRERAAGRVEPGLESGPSRGDRGDGPQVLPGSEITLRLKCGKPGCRCATGSSHHEVEGTSRKATGLNMAPKTPEPTRPPPMEPPPASVQ
jgi:hypothetical protein